jgi:hypothetical protein
LDFALSRAAAAPASFDSVANGAALEELDLSVLAWVFFSEAAVAAPAAFPSSSNKSFFIALSASSCFFLV